MGAGGEATRRWASRRADARAEAPQEAGGKSDLRRGTRGAFARGRRQTSYEKLHELADWKRIGLHDKYADATMVRDPDHERGERARRRRATVRSALSRTRHAGNRRTRERFHGDHVSFFFFFSVTRAIARL